jgi:exopolysaccharide biosynthesis polyprenyl glycosylphosphotransferase
LTEVKPKLVTPPALTLGLAGVRPVGSSTRTASPSKVAPGTAWAKRYRAKLVVTDFVIIVATVGASYFARFGLGEEVAITGEYLALSALIVGTWVASLAAYHTRDARVVGVGLAEYKQVVHASFLTFGLLAVIFLVLKIDIARGFFVVALPVGLVGLMGSRWLWRQWLTKQREFGNYLSRVIVVGGRKDVEYVVGHIERKWGAAYNVVGTAIDGEDRGPVRVGARTVPVVADVHHVARATALVGADAVIVAGKPASAPDTYIRDLGWDLEGTGAELVLASGLTNVAGPRIHFRPVEGLPLMHVELPQYEGAKHVMKRALDVTVSGLALIFLLPLMAVIAAMVKADSPGPVIFRQERVGRGGQTFHMLKFRSMVETAEDDLAGLLDRNEGAGLLFKIKNDPRVTRVGQVLRKYSLDELPQLWNILVGDMSLVGPRPPLPREVEGYEGHVKRRLFIKPGLTGMWQVNGRSNLSWEESVRLDLYYVENWSITGDLVIMWRTFRVLTTPVGAY